MTETATLITDLTGTTKDKPVIIVGSGAAGLAAAFRLKQAGMTVRILEADDVVGGKLRSQQRDGFTIDTGVYFLPTAHRRMLALAAEAGFADQIDPRGSVLSIARNGKVHEIDIDHALRDFIRTDLFSTPSKLSMVKLARTVWCARKANYEQLPNLSRFDEESADAWARGALGDELTDYLVGTVMRGFAATSPADASHAEFLALMDVAMDTKLVACRGGMGTYASELSAGMDVELGARVQEVVKQGDGVNIIWHDKQGREHSELAAGCVVAGSTETAINIVPQLDTWRKQYLGRTPDYHMCTISVGLSRPPKGISALYTIVPETVHPGLSGIGFDHNKARGRVPEGKGLISLVPLVRWGAELARSDDEHVVNEVCAVLDTVIPGILPDIEFTQVNHWQQRLNPIGHYKNLGRFRDMCNSQDTTIQLAGDYFGYADVESAIKSGENAAKNMINKIAR